MPTVAGKKDVIIVDLDGTLALDHHRVHHLHGPNGERDWDTYFSLCSQDEPNHGIIAIVDKLRHFYEIHILTGRSESVRDDTERWLSRHGVVYSELRMRPVSEREDDHTLKIKWGGELGGLSRVLVVFEDRARVVRAWRAAGYTVCQVAPGEF